MIWWWLRNFTQNQIDFLTRAGAYGILKLYPSLHRNNAQETNQRTEVEQQELFYCPSERIKINCVFINCKFRTFEQLFPFKYLCFITSSIFTTSLHINWWTWWCREYYKVLFSIHGTYSKWDCNIIQNLPACPIFKTCI